MFQTFEATTSPSTGAVRLKMLREELARRGLNGFLVPRADAHQGENVAPADERLAWLTGFTGSAGLGLVLADKAGVEVDGRYRLQAVAQCDSAAFTPVHVPPAASGSWLAEHAPRGAKIGYDPMLHTDEQIKALEAVLAPKAATLVKCQSATGTPDNPIDAIWADQPRRPAAPIVPHPLEFAGVPSADKRAALAEGLRKAGLAACVLSLPDSIAWLLNLRGADIARTPVVLAFAIAYDDEKVDLFVDPARITPALSDHFGPDIRPVAPGELGAVLHALDVPVGVDLASAPVWIADQLEHPRPYPDPCRLPKARKNPAELAGMRAAHLRDGAAMAEFLFWLDETAPKGGLTEIDVVTKLEAIRTSANQMTDISFETICGAGPNGAIIHYRVTKETNRAVNPGELLLVDSGAQYLDGTTDITRTVAIGTAPPEAIAPFTRVLAGLIDMSRLRFPEGIAGAHIDVLARAALWAAGQDYDHGTGHGVGAYLGVHEGPHGLARRAIAPIEAGVVLSNEPGYYREGAFGIRLENLMATTPALPVEGGDRPMHAFETITLAPIDRRLIEAALLNSAQRDWLNSYHARVLAEIGPLVSAACQTWLREACAPIS
ncbi:MAG: aminopeptidase P family protein [Paracoccaceae bacterium]